MKENLATKWLDGEISLGKLIQESGLPRPDADDFAGMFWQAIAEKAHAVESELKRKLAFAEKSLAEAKADYKKDDIAAEAAYVTAYTTALASFRMQFGHLIN